MRKGEGDPTTAGLEERGMVALETPGLETAKGIERDGKTDETNE